MEISFILGDVPQVHAFKYEDLFKDPRDAGWLSIDRDFFYLIKALENNEDFARAVYNARERLGIPTEGYSYSDYHNMEFNAYTNPRTKEDTKKYERWFDRVKKEADKIKRSLELNEEIKFAIPDIIIANCVYPPRPREIWFGYRTERGRVTDVSIYLQRRISKNELHEWIDKNWDATKKRWRWQLSLEEAVRQLPPRNNLFIREVDQFIVRLRDQKKMKFREIAELLDRIYHPEGTSINEFSVKVAYHRAKKKITSVAKPKHKTR